MGLEVGFSFYKKQGVYERDGVNYVKIKEIKPEELGLDDSVYVCGRCDATYEFTNVVEHSLNIDQQTLKDLATKITKTFNYKDTVQLYTELIVNDPSIHGYIIENENVDYIKYEWGRRILNYLSLQELKNSINFEEATNDHNKSIDKAQQEILTIKQNIESLRTHQENAQTDAAFKGFQTLIEDDMERIDEANEYLDYLKNDDYDYNHYLWIKEMFEIVDKVLLNHTDILVTAWTSY